MPTTRYSRYVLIIDNISASTPSKDVEREFASCGKVRDCVNDSKLRCALVEFYSSADADYAWRRMNGFTMDGRKWKVEWATPADFKVFGWRWTEGSYRRSRSRSRSASRSRSPSRERSHSPQSK